MNSKFYVSLEVEELLIEKGYHVDKNIPIYNKYGDITRCYPADRPTKAEAIDWLESKGIVITVDVYYIMHEEDDYYTSCWSYCIEKDDETVCRDNSSEYKTRLEAEDAAIIKGCKLLENGN